MTSKAPVRTVTTKAPDEKIAKVQANLPLPEEPPVASDWNSADVRPVQEEAREEVKQATRESESKGIPESSYGPSIAGSNSR